MELIIHGGFISESSTAAEIKKAKQESLKNIAEKAYAYLARHTATETVVYAVSMLEDDKLFNAGLGSQIQSDGKIRLSASLMDGQSAKFSGVINIQNIQNPIQLASQLMQEEDRVLASEEANLYAEKRGIPFFSPEIPERRKEYAEKLSSLKTSTVGCVARDRTGCIAAATSTGGKGFEIPGRVSDSATTSGNYANKFAGVSCTGVGEDIVSVALASKIVTRISDGFSISGAFEKSFGELKTIDGFAGAIAIDRNGEIYHSESHPYMVWAKINSEGIQVFKA